MSAHFTDRELDVMKVLWRDGPATVAEVRERLEDDLAYTTVLTVLRTLEEKHHVGHREEGKAHRYFAKVPEHTARQSALARVLDRVFGGSAELLLTHLVSDRSLSADELNRLRALIDKGRKTGKKRMIISLIGYSICVAAALAGVGAILERLAADRRRPRRFIWAAAMAAALGLTILAPWRGALDAAAAAVLSRLAAGGAAPHGTGTIRLGDAAALLRASVDAAAAALIQFDRACGRLWAIGSAAVLLVRLLGWRMLWIRRRAWRRVVVADVPVWLSSSDGPAVVGAWSPEIVLPDWALALPPEALRLTLSHEREHQRARDPLLIHLARLAPALMPWNPAVWWMVSRLKLAVEVDCDARVLGLTRASDVADLPHAPAYAELLLTVAAKRSSGSGLLEPAMLERSSHLGRRLSAMYASRIDRSPTRAAALGAAALLCSAMIITLPAPVLHARTPQSASTSKEFGKGAYKAGEHGVTYPVPIHQVDPEYTREAMSQKITGVVRLEFVVNADGTVGEMRIVKSLDKKYGLDEATREAAAKWQFKPATLHGHPVPVICEATMEFRLR